MYFVFQQIRLDAFEKFMPDQNHHEKAEDFKHFSYIENKHWRYHNLLENYNGQLKCGEKDRDHHKHKQGDDNHFFKNFEYFFHTVIPGRGLVCGYLFYKNKLLPFKVLVNFLMDVFSGFLLSVLRIVS